MNDVRHTDEKIESMLQGLPLRQPSRMLDERIERALSHGRRFAWRKIAVAACFGGVCFGLGLLTGQREAGPANDPSAVEQAVTPPTQRTTPAPSPGLRLASDTTRIDQQWPVAQAQVLYDLGDGPPVRATIRDAIERTRWVDTDNQSDIELTRPVREIRFTRDTPY